jgi:hypothetical protein
MNGGHFTQIKEGFYVRCAARKPVVTELIIDNYSTNARFVWRGF